MEKLQLIDLFSKLIIHFTNIIKIYNRNIQQSLVKERKKT